jgi:hypothetical protein
MSGGRVVTTDLMFSINDEKLDILEHPLDGSGENQLNLYKYFPGRFI